MEQDKYIAAGVIGDGVHDDTEGIQALLDSEAGRVFLPKPSQNYLISSTLKIHSCQTLELDRAAVIRLADHAHVHMLTNFSHSDGNENIEIIGGIWDGNNKHQTCDYHELMTWRVPYDPARYLGVVMQFNNVRNLKIEGLTIKDPETFGIQIGNIEYFTVEDIYFDYNMLKLNMDGVHLHGNCRKGRICNLKGATNDDMVALNADDGAMYEMSRGPIEDILVDGLWADGGYTAVRLLSAGSPIRRIRLANIFGTYRYNVVSFTHHNVHPGSASEFEDILLDGLFCSKAVDPSNEKFNAEYSRHPLIWVADGVNVHNLSLQNFTRSEKLANSPPSVHVMKNSRIDKFFIRGISHMNHTDSPFDFMVNDGSIVSLSISDMSPDTTIVNNGIIENAR